jgi:beta-N-acetylhexosaminidase
VSPQGGELDRLAAACLFPGFAGLEPPTWLRAWVGAGLGGVVLFARNVAGLEQLAALTWSLRAERPDALVAIDEEGGDVTRLETEHGSSYPGNYALGAIDDVALTERVARAMGADLAAIGIDLDLAPVADVNSNPDNPIIGVRSFGSDPALVARHVKAFVTGMQSVGVGACAKHFPGHGDTNLDSHLDLPVLEAGPETIAARELPPFRAAVEAGVRAVMTAHIVVRALDDEPATLSAATLRVLRGDLGFQGVVITDALEMGAVSRSAPMGEIAVRALGAGADALCLGADVDAGTVERVHTAIVEAVRAGRLDEQRLAEAAGRVAELSPSSRAADAPSAEGRVGIEAARRAVRAEGDVAAAGPLLVVELRPPPSIAAGEAGRGLGAALRARVRDIEIVRLDSPPEDAKAVLAARGGRRLVLVLRDAHRHGWQRATAETLLAEAGNGIIVETGIAAWRPEAASGYVITYGAGRVNLEAAAELVSP